MKLVDSGTSESVRAPGPIASQFRSTLFVITSTANVAMPAARPDRRMSATPTRNAKRPPTAAARTSEIAFPTSALAMIGKRSGLSESFSASGTVVRPAAKAPTATKLTCPNETTPEFPMKT